MRMDREKTDGPMISAIGRAGFKVDDGYYTALSISPERADGWTPPAFETLGEADVAALLALAALLFLGGHVLRGFTAAMILGIFVGTYSSIYVSSSLLISLGLRAEPEGGAARPGRGGMGNAERVGPRN